MDELIKLIKEHVLNEGLNIDETIEYILKLKQEVENMTASANAKP